MDSYMSSLYLFIYSFLSWASVLSASAQISLRADGKVFSTAEQALLPVVVSCVVLACSRHGFLTGILDGLAFIFLGQAMDGDVSLACVAVPVAARELLELRRAQSASERACIALRIAQMATLFCTLSGTLALPWHVVFLPMYYAGGYYVTVQVRAHATLSHRLRQLARLLPVLGPILASLAMLNLKLINPSLPWAYTHCLVPVWSLMICWLVAMVSTDNQSTLVSLATISSQSGAIRQMFSEESDHCGSELPLPTKEADLEMAASSAGNDKSCLL
ncbi:hypothetical protein RI367_004704 [Sorochytrium milnesiophthora]